MTRYPDPDAPTREPMRRRHPVLKMRGDRTYRPRRVAHHSTTYTRS